MGKREGKLTLAAPRANRRNKTVPTNSPTMAMKSAHQHLFEQSLLHHHARGTYGS